MPAFAAIPLRGLNGGSSSTTVSSGGLGTGGQHHNDNNSRLRSSSARGPPLHNVFGGDEDPRSANGSARRNTSSSSILPHQQRSHHHLTGLGPNASWDDEPTGILSGRKQHQLSSLSDSASSAAGVLGYRVPNNRNSEITRARMGAGGNGGGGGGGVVLTGGGIRRQHPAGIRPSIPSLVPVRPQAVHHGGASVVAPVPPRRGPVTVQELLAEQKRIQLEQSGGAGNHSSSDIYSSALLADMNGVRSGGVSRPIAPRRSKQSTLWLVPMEVLLDLFSYLDYRSVCFSGAVSVRWQVLSEHPLIWRTIAHRCGPENVRLTPHCNPKEVIRRYVLTHRAEMDQELLVVESQLQNTNRRLEERLQAMPPFVAPLQEEHDDAETRRLPTVITSAEGKMSEMNSKIDSFSQLQQTLTRAQRENKNALVRTDGELRKAEALLATVRSNQQQEANILGFEIWMIRALTDGLNAELPLVLRRGLSTFFELELLVLQTNNGGTNNSQLSQRWNGFKKSFPLDETWMELKSRIVMNSNSSGGGGGGGTTSSASESPLLLSTTAPYPKGNGTKYTPKEALLFAEVQQLKELSPRDLKKYVENL